MSVIRKKPEINKIIDDLTDAEKLKLAQEVNNEAPLYTKSLIRKDYYFSELNNNAYEIAGILLEVAPTNTLPGIVIRTNNSNNLREYFIQFAHKQKLIEWRLNTINRTAEVIDEDLDINELRRLLEEVHDHIVASEIDSGSATAGQVLSADGEGGTEWANPMDTIHSDGVSEGDVVEIFGFDSQGNLKKDSVPEGITVDQTIIEDSENAVAGGAVYDLKEDVDALEAEMEEKANVNGNYPTMTVGAADNLTPYDEDSGIDQEQPFLLQGTGCGNGEQQVDTGALGLLKEKQGNTVVVNQKIYSTITQSFTTTEESPIGWVPDDPVSWLTNAGEMINGHKYIGIMTSSSDKITVKDDANGRDAVGIFEQDEYRNGRYFAFVLSALPAGTYTVSFVCIDLTQWFGSNDNIPAHLLAHPEDFFRYYQGSLAYNEGTLVNANGRYLKAIGRNQWDEELEDGVYSLSSGSKSSASSGYMRSKNFIKVVPNTTYYRGINYWSDGHILFYDKDKNFISSISSGSQGTFTTPSNCCYITFFLNYGGTTYNNDITISIYYEGESGYDQYYPYEELTNNDTGTEVLRSAGSVADIKLPDGTITRRIGVVDLGTLSWMQGGDTHTFFAAIPDAKATANNVNNAISSLYSNKGEASWTQYTTYGDLTFGHEGGTKRFYFANSNYSSISDFAAAMSGVMFYYELAEPTTEQGTPYSENIAIDDFGSMDFGGTNGVPQGASIFYAVDYKAFIDSLYNTLDGDATDVVKDSELDSKLATLGYVKLTSVSGYDATKTQVLKNVEGTLTWVTEE